jgi:hypothetical protein
MKGESSSALRELLNNTLKHTRGLGAFRQLTGIWNRAVLHLVSLKHYIVMTEMKSIGIFCQQFKKSCVFLLQRCQDLEVAIIISGDD